MPPDVPAAFFSYCRADSEVALKLAEDLKAVGANVWIGQLDIKPGTPWDRAVEEALTRSPRMLVILSPVRGEFIKSRGDRRLVQPATVLLPAIRGKAYRRRSAARIWQLSFQPRVRPVLIKIPLKLLQLRLQVRRRPE